MPVTETQSNRARAVVPPGFAEFYEPLRCSPGVEVDGTLYVSGQVGMAPNGTPIDDQEQQTVAAFEALKAVLEHGGYAFSDVVQLLTYHTSFDELAAFMAIKDRYVLGPVLPTWTAIGVASLALPGLVVEIQATAVRPR